MSFFNSDDEKLSYKLLMRFNTTSAAIECFMNDQGCDQYAAEEAVMGTMLKLIGGAPQEIRGSAETVISWWRWNEMYLKARNTNNFRNMTEAQSHMDKLIRDLH